MITKVKNTVRSRFMLSEGDRVIVALSGGADSAVLLDVLLRLKEELKLTVMAAHVNHLLRGDESARDEAFVKSLCKEKGVQLFVKTADVGALAKESGEGFELVGRKVRYDFFSALSKEHDAFVATAHTASDAAETALLNIARGTSISGLCSIPYVRGRIIRPLLDVTREEVESYAEKNGVSFVDDSTNFDADICNRNKVRHKVVPVLKEVNSSFEENYIKLRDQLIMAEQYIKTQAEALLLSAETAYGYNTEKLLDASEVIRNFAVKLILERAGAGAEQKHILLILDCLKAQGAVNLCGGFRAVSKQGVLRVCKAESLMSSEIPLKINQSFVFGGKRYFVKELSQEEIVNKKLSTLCVGCDKISGDAVLRVRQKGDRFAPLNRNVTKDLRKLQNELKIPSEERDRMLLLAQGDVILWAEGIGASEQGRYVGDKGIYIEFGKEDKNA